MELGAVIHAIGAARGLMDLFGSRIRHDRWMGIVGRHSLRHDVVGWCQKDNCQREDERA
jgi:hypothetical protein